MYVWLSTKLLFFFFPLQYGSDEFTDSPRYTSPNPSGGYYLSADGAPGSGVGDWHPSSYGTAASYQTYEAYGLIPENENQGLPPMSSLRPNGTTVTALSASTNNSAFGAANHPDGVNKALGTVGYINSVLLLNTIRKKILDLPHSRTSQCK